MYKHILLAIDLGDENKQVVAKAEAVQKLTGAKVSIIHVIAPLPAVYSAYGIYGVGEAGISNDVVANTEAYEENAKTSLLPVAESIGLSAADIVISSGNESDEILDYAEDNDVDVIISGSHGRHGLRLLLGSTANSILHGAKCDVLAVRIKE